MALISGGTPPGEVASGLGFTNNDFNCGWNFNFWPGTTTRELPLEALRSHFDVEETRTAERFAAGTSLGGNGIFGMKLQEELPGATDPTRIGPPKYWLGQAEYERRIKDSCYDPSFRARKSVFCFDDRIICLGSGIRAEDPKHPVRTTLFQCQLTEADKARLPFPEERTLESGKGNWVLDRNGNGFYVAPGNDPVLLSRAHRALPYHSHWNIADTNLHNRMVPNEGDTELALLDHGSAPADRGYEYCILVRAGGDEAMRAFADRMGKPDTAFYEVLRKDDAAHVVMDRPSRTTGYVLFEAGTTLPAEGALETADKPCLVMLREHAPGRLSVSVCDPMVGGDVESLRAGVPEPTEVTLKLRGRWQPGGGGPARSVETGDARTVIVVKCGSLMPVGLTLTQGAKP
jgi:chondroitin-sulfate-ABC endolyase/exolyase